jgi:antitoxin (DNA-binding transcriptional repressor) of toxin-antitoxin stability system
MVELAEIKALLSELTNRVIGGEGVEVLETGRAAVANQLVNTRLRALEVERKIRESDELEARIEELSEAFSRQQQKGGGAYGS